MAKSLQESFRTARKAARVSQLLVAEHAGVSRPTVSAIERKGREPRLRELGQLAALFRVSPEAVMRGAVLPNEEELELPQADRRTSFRAAGGKKLDPQDAWELAYARVRLNDCDQAQANEPGRIGLASTIPAASAAVRTRLGCERGDLPLDVFKALYQLGQPVQFTALSKISGALVRSEDHKRSVIVINSDQPSDRQRWTAVHEFAHLICGHHGQDAEHVDQYGPARDPSDQQADSIAAEVLMPTQEVVERLEQVDSATPEALYELADRFRVSYAAMVLRCGSLKYLSSAQVTDLRTAKPTQLEKRLGLKARRTARFAPEAVLPELVARLHSQGELPSGWEHDFSKTGPLYLRQLQREAVRDYVLETNMAQRQTSVTEIFEAVASWLAKTHPWFVT